MQRLQALVGKVTEAATEFHEATKGGVRCSWVPGAFLCSNEPTLWFLGAYTKKVHVLCAAHAAPCGNARPMVTLPPELQVQRDEALQRC